MNVGLYHQTWQRARSALANYLYEAYGTDGCSQEGEDSCWMETARLKATQFHPDVLTEEEKKEKKKEEAYEKKLAAQRERAEGRAAALALVAAARNRKKRRLTQAMSDGDDEVSTVLLVCPRQSQSRLRISIPLTRNRPHSSPLQSARNP
jgi:hypothetical protein